MGHRRPPQSSTSKSTKEVEILERRHHNYMIELFLDESGEVSDIFIDHDQSKKPEKISGWDPGKLIDFIARHAGLRAANPKLEELTDNNKHTLTVTATDASIEPSYPKKHAPPSKVSSKLTGTLHLRDFKVVPVDPKNSPNLLPHNQPFTVRLTLDLTEVVASRGNPLVYEATVIAKQLGGAERTAAKTHKRIEATKNTVINVNCSGLAEGLYRLSALVKLVPAGMEHDSAVGIVAYLEGGDPIEVY